MMPLSRSDLVVVRRIAGVHEIAIAEWSGPITAKHVLCNWLSARLPAGTTVLNQAS